MLLHRPPLLFYSGSGINTLHYTVIYYSIQILIIDKFFWSAPAHLDKNDASSRRSETKKSYKQNLCTQFFTQTFLAEDLSDFEKLSYVEKCRYILDRNGDISTLKILPVDIEFGVIDSLLSRVCFE